MLSFFPLLKKMLTLDRRACQVLTPGAQPPLTQGNSRRLANGKQHRSADSWTEFLGKPTAKKTEKHEIF
jgi:hypothetical protein